jgi:A/G-specific adenine glycosylase
LQAPHLSRIARATETWFASHQRALPWRTAYDPYHVWLSEVMLQQTRMEVVLPYFSRFLTRFPSTATLAAATADEVMAAWSGLGYYKRARMLREGAAIVEQRFGGKVPETLEELLTIPGIGRYTAGAIASIAWNRPAPIVDGNIARITARLFAIDAATGSPALLRAAWKRAGDLVSACEVPREFNQGLMEIGALICKPRNPNCEVCPLAGFCTARISGQQDRFPRPKPSELTHRLHVPLYFIGDGEGRVLMLRENGPLMNAMYHLPHGNTTLLQTPPLEVQRAESLGSFRHAITNRRVEFELYTATLDSIRDAPGTYEWIDPACIADVPHPSYVRKALSLATTSRPDA